MLSTKYINYSQRLKFICPHHPNEIQEVVYECFRSGTGCHSCVVDAIKEARKARISVVEQIFREAGYELVPEQIYTTSAYKYKYICKKHGIQEMSLDNMRGGKRCPYCARENNSERFRLDYDYVKSEFEKVGYTLISKTYKNAKQKIKYICSEHGEQTATWSNFKKGRRCPLCASISNGEDKINKWLDDNNIVHCTQMTFEDLVSDKGYKLRFDFGVFDSDKKLLMVIEYDGEQHFKPIKYFGGKESFERDKYLDNLKNEYCKDNNIKLVRIPYTDFSILEQVLSREILGGEVIGHS